MGKWNRFKFIRYNSQMQKLTALLILLFSIACVAQESTRGTLADGGTAAASSPARQPVLLELFTSEGCASCPPAEKNLAYLQTEQPYSGADIITLAFHVDYWDGLGWRDPFASPLFTQRQKVYDRKFRTGNIYTPQMVVDGDIEFIGSKLDRAEKAISRAAKEEKARIFLSLDGDILSLQISSVPKSDVCSVYLAIAEDGLSSAVRRGENAGKTLSHVSVVRSLTGIGRLGAGETSFKAEAPMSIENSWDRSRIKAVVFVQENHTRRIIGAAAIRLGSLAP